MNPMTEHFMDFSYLTPGQAGAVLQRCNDIIKQHYSISSVTNRLWFDVSMDIQERYEMVKKEIKGRLNEFTA